MLVCTARDGGGQVGTEERPDCLVRTRGDSLSEQTFLSAYHKISIVGLTLVLPNMPAALTFKHFSSIAFNLSHLSPTLSTRSSRLLLSAIPAKPSPKYPQVPTVTVKTTDGVGSMEMVYSDKKTLKIDLDGDLKYEDLRRKVRARDGCRRQATTEAPMPVRSLAEPLPWHLRPSPLLRWKPQREHCV